MPPGHAPRSAYRGPALGAALAGLRAGGGPAGPLVAAGSHLLSLEVPGLPEARARPWPTRLV